MAFTRRGKFTLGLTAAAVVVAAGVAGFATLTGNDDSENPLVGGSEKPVCPLTAEEPRNGTVPDRPALALKVENLDVARPQAGLDRADVVYEQPVEGGITRFIVVFHCQGADRVGPIRSARLVDPDVLVQYGRPLFGYAGGVQEVINQVKQAGLRDVNYDIAVDAYEQDPNRQAPHDQYTATKDLYAFAQAGGGAPGPVFRFSLDRPRQGSRRASEVHVDFSPAANVFWRYDRQDNAWLRFHDDTPHTLEDGDQVSARNLIVQVVQVTESQILDAAGNPSPEVDVFGSGKVYVFRDGRVIRGRWVRASPEQVTELVDRQGEEILLAPGNTWVELFPSDRPLDFGR